MFPDHAADLGAAALIAEEPVAFTQVIADRERGAIWSAMTGVAPAHRGRGLARLVKAHSLLAARSAGMIHAYTANDTANAADACRQHVAGLPPGRPRLVCAPADLTNWSATLTTVMRILLIGAPGSGKGTQADRLAAHYDVTHISSGDLLRAHVRDETPLGVVVKTLVENGDLVPDAVVMDMLRKPVLAAAADGGYILDGFPRTVAQAKVAYAVAQPLGVEVQVAIHLDVDRDELVRRLLARSRGTEDSPDVIEHRLDVYLQETVPLVGYYDRREWLVHVDGGQPPDVVTQSIIEGIEQRVHA